MATIHLEIDEKDLDDIIEYLESIQDEGPSGGHGWQSAELTRLIGCLNQTNGRLNK